MLKLVDGDMGSQLEPKTQYPMEDPRLSFKSFSRAYQKGSRLENDNLLRYPKNLMRRTMLQGLETVCDALHGLTITSQTKFIKRLTTNAAA